MNSPGRLVLDGLAQLTAPEATDNQVFDSRCVGSEVWRATAFGSSDTTCSVVSARISVTTPASCQEANDDTSIQEFSSEGHSTFLGLPTSNHEDTADKLSQRTSSSSSALFETSNTDE